ncbi:ATP-dependent Clp protease ATP-binding subunit [Gordonia polyisoprenivorans]|uniref:AAA family ATPase n=1 Tax=Gordonia polyisoprenivorans TaxID=84595 RepID=UPI001B8D8354|nr:AAA family ATPase [Gordonia polyisoprenivorans]QUD84533.1 ATP-dependent Clp protease ATP-binding subunit [Gordonia polyisoprenivorans]
MSGYLANKVDDINSGQQLSPGQNRAFRMGRASSPAQLSSALRSAIIGQDAAIDSVVRALTIAAAGIGDPRQPIASLLFVGPTGVGKTELARRLAAELTGDADKLCRIDMNTLAQEHYAASLSGAPPGYSGAKEQFTLFDRELVEGNTSRPGIVLFDEVEKAHTTVLRSLLQILDSGTLRLAAGNSTIDFRNAIVLLTSNLGSAEIAAHHRARSHGWRTLLPMSGSRRRDAGSDAVDRAVEEFFDPELYNRFDEIVRFDPIGPQVAAAIVDVELRRLTAQLAARQIRWEPDDPLRSHLARIGFDPIYGARDLARTLRMHLHAPLAEAIVSWDREPGTTLRMRTSVDSGKICVAIEPVSTVPLSTEPLSGPTNPTPVNGQT